MKKGGAGGSRGHHARKKSPVFCKSTRLALLHLLLKFPRRAMLSRQVMAILSWRLQRFPKGLSRFAAPSDLPQRMPSAQQLEKASVHQFSHGYLATLIREARRRREVRALERQELAQKGPQKPLGAKMTKRAALAPIGPKRQNVYFCHFGRSRDSLKTNTKHTSQPSPWAGDHFVQKILETVQIDVLCKMFTFAIFDV